MPCGWLGYWAGGSHNLSCPSPNLFLFLFPARDSHPSLSIIKGTVISALSHSFSANSIGSAQDDKNKRAEARFILLLMCYFPYND